MNVCVLADCNVVMQSTAAAAVHVERGSPDTLPCCKVHRCCLYVLLVCAGRNISTPYRTRTRRRPLVAEWHAATASWRTRHLSAKLSTSASKSDVLFTI